MSRFQPQYMPPVMGYQTVESVEPGVLSRFMSNVYAWMSAGLALTAVVAWWVASQGTQYLGTIFNPGTLILLIVVELGLVFAISYAVNKISPGVATGLFLLYAALNGLTLSAIFFAYKLGDIGLAFGVTAGMFGGMSLIGYTTKMDLTSLRGFLIMGLVGIVIASIVNIFMASTMLYWIISYAGVAVFLGLTAYDTQKLKHIAYATQGDPRMANRLAITGALSLYLDFI